MTLSTEPNGAPHARRVTWDEIEHGATDKITLTPTQELGYRLFQIVLIAIAVGAAALTIYAFLTWPRPGEVQGFLSAMEPADQANALLDLRLAWHSEFRNLAQTLLVGPLVPLLSTIIGYVLGREAR